LERFEFCSNIPRQEFLDAVDRMVCDALEDIAQISFTAAS
jgi:hypothetical protein